MVTFLVLFRQEAPRCHFADTPRNTQVSGPLVITAAPGGLQGLYRHLCLLMMKRKLEEVKQLDPG